METRDEKLIERRETDTESERKNDPNSSPKKIVQLGVVSSQEGGRVSLSSSSKKSRWDQAPELEKASQSTTQEDPNFPNVKSLIQKFEDNSNSSSETSKEIDSGSSNAQKPTRVKLVRTNFMPSNKEKPAANANTEKENIQSDFSKVQDTPDEKELKKETETKNVSPESSEVQSVTSSKALQIISSYYDSPTDESSQEGETLPTPTTTESDLPSENLKLVETAEIVDNLKSIDPENAIILKNSTFVANPTENKVGSVFLLDSEVGEKIENPQDKQDIRSENLAINLDSFKTKVDPTNTSEIVESVNKSSKEDKSKNPSSEELSLDSKHLEELNDDNLPPEENVRYQSSTLSSSPDSKDVITEEENTKQIDIESKSLQKSKFVEKTSPKNANGDNEAPQKKQINTLEEDPKPAIVQISNISDQPVDDWVVVTEQDLKGYCDSEIAVEEDKVPAISTDTSKMTTFDIQENLKSDSTKLASSVDKSSEDENNKLSKAAEGKVPVQEELCSETFMYLTEDNLKNASSSNVQIETSDISLSSQEKSGCNKQTAVSNPVDKDTKSEEDELKKRSIMKSKVEKQNPENAETPETSQNVAPLEEESAKSRQDEVQLYADEIDATMEEMFFEDKGSKNASDSNICKDNVAILNKPSTEKVLETNSSHSKESENQEVDSRGSKEKSSQVLLDILETTESDISTKTASDSSTSNREENAATIYTCQENLVEESLDQKDDSLKNHTDKISSESENEKDQTSQISEGAENVSCNNVTKTETFDDGNCNINKDTVKHEIETTSNVEFQTKENLTELATVEVSKSKSVVESEDILIKEPEKSKDLNLDGNDKAENSSSDCAKTNDADDLKSISKEETETELQEKESDLIQRGGGVSIEVEKDKVEIVDSVAVIEEFDEVTKLDSYVTTVKLESSENKLLLGNKAEDEEGTFKIFEPEKVISELEKRKHMDIFSTTSIPQSSTNELTQIIKSQNLHEELIDDSKTVVVEDTMNSSQTEGNLESNLLNQKSDLKSAENIIEDPTKHSAETIVEKLEEQNSDSGPTDAVVRKENCMPASTDDAAITIEAIDSFLKESDEDKKDVSDSLKSTSEEISGKELEVVESEQELKKYVETNATPTLGDSDEINNVVILEGLTTDDVLKLKSDVEKSEKQGLEPSITKLESFANDQLVLESYSIEAKTSEAINANQDKIQEDVLRLHEDNSSIICKKVLTTSEVSLKIQSESREVIQNVEKVVVQTVKEELDSQSKVSVGVQDPKMSCHKLSQSKIIEKDNTQDLKEKENISNKRSISETGINVEERNKKTKVVLDSILDKKPVDVQIESTVNEKYEVKSPTESSLLVDKCIKVLMDKQITQKEDTHDEIMSRAEVIEQSLIETNSPVAEKDVSLSDLSISSTIEVKPTEQTSSNEVKNETESIPTLATEVQLESLASSLECPQQTKSLEANSVRSSSQDIIITDKTEISPMKIETSDIEEDISLEETDLHTNLKTVTETNSAKEVMTLENQSKNAPKDKLTSSIQSSSGNLPKSSAIIAESKKESLTSGSETKTSGLVSNSSELLKEAKPVVSKKATIENKPVTKSKVLIKRPVQIPIKDKSSTPKTEVGHEVKPKLKDQPTSQIHTPVPVEFISETKSVSELSICKNEEEIKTKDTLLSKIESSDKSVQEPTKPLNKTNLATEMSINESKLETKPKIVIKRPTQVSNKNKSPELLITTKPETMVTEKIELEAESTEVLTFSSQVEHQCEPLESTSQIKPASEKDLETKTKDTQLCKVECSEPTGSKDISEKSPNENKLETTTKVTIKRPLQISGKNQSTESSAEPKSDKIIATKEQMSEHKSKTDSFEQVSVVPSQIPENPTPIEPAKKIDSRQTEMESPEESSGQNMAEPVVLESTVKAKPIKEVPPVTPVRVSARQKQRQAAAAEKKAQQEKSTPESAPQKGPGVDKVGDKQAKASPSPTKEIHIKIPGGKSVETKPSLISTQKSPKTPVSPIAHGKLEPITLKLSKEENPVIVRSSSLSPKKVLSPQSPQTKTLGYTLKIGKDSTTIIPKDPSLSPNVRDSSPSSSGSKSDTFGKVEYLIKDTGLTITPVTSAESQEQKLSKITLKLSKAGGHPEIKQDKNESWKAIQKLGEIDITPVEAKSSVDSSKRKDKADLPSSEKKLKISHVTVEPSTSSGPSKLQGLLTQAPLNQADISVSGSFAGIGQPVGKEPTGEPLYEIGLLKPEEAPVPRKRGRPRKISSPDQMSAPITHSLSAKNILAASLQHQTLQQQIQMQQLQQQQAMAAMMQPEEDDSSIPMFQCPLFDLSDPMDSFMEPHPTIFPDQVQPVQEPILRSARGRPIGRSRRSRGAGISRGIERGGPRGRPRGSRGIKRMLEEMESLSYPDMEQPITLDNIDAEIPRIIEPVMATETTIALLRKSIEIKKENKARKPEEPESLHSDLEAKVREMKEKIEAAYKAELKSPVKTSPEKEAKKKKLDEKTPEKTEAKKGPPELIPIPKKEDKSNISPRKLLDSSPRKSLESPRKSFDSPRKPPDSPRKSSDSPRKSSDSLRKSLDEDKQKRTLTDEKDSDNQQKNEKQGPKRKISQDMTGQEKELRKSTEETGESVQQEGEESQESKDNEGQEEMEVEQASSQDSIQVEEVKKEPEPPPKPVKPRPKSKAEMKRIKREKDRLRREAKKLAALEALKAPPPNPNEEDTRMSASDPNGDGTDGVKKSRGMEVGDPEGKEFTVADIAEYQWPLQGGELYMIQEQISTYLGVKSFKRKYPELRRRPVEMEERTYLCDSGLVAESMCDLGLTAVSSSEVLDVLFQDFPDKYEELRKVMREKAAQELINKQKEKKKFEQSLSKSDLKEHALQSAMSWNQSLNRSRTETRKCHLDLQTWTIQYPRSRGAKMSKPSPKLGNYPVAVIPGQYTDYYKRYTAQELRYWPVNTVLYGPLQPNERNSTVGGSEGSQSESEDSSSSDDSSDSSSDGDGTEEEKEKVGVECRACTGRKDSKMPCTQCGRNMHNSCANLSPSRLSNVRKYQNQCSARKTCQRCNSCENESRMIFCEKCDRGFHSYCVGLRRVPYGSWKCQFCSA